MKVETKLRELLLPVLGLDSIDEVPPDVSLVEDLDADSIDFVEILYVVEQNFGVVLKTDEIVVAGIDSKIIFQDGRLTKKGAELIGTNLPAASGRYKEGMTKIELFSALTVNDLAHIIKMKMTPKEEE
ncbi:MAG: hypothetical protein GY950_10580 [bacterium]|nr:hypothetical protein [bacterium]